MNLHYILECKTPKPIADISEWGKWMQSANRVLKKTDLFNDITVSTVFLGIDYDFFGGIPILFETMIFGGEYDGYCERYATWEEAEQGHEEAINLIFEV